MELERDARGASTGREGERGEGRTCGGGRVGGWEWCHGEEVQGGQCPAAHGRPCRAAPERAGSVGSRRGLGQSHLNILTQVAGPSVLAELPPAAGLGSPRDPRLTAHGAEGMFLAEGSSVLLASSDF